MQLNKNAEASVQVNGLTAKINVTNLTQDDFLFITGLVKVFTDPAHADDLKSFRSGFTNIGYTPSAGLTFYYTNRQN